MELVGEDDILILTADHGCDPTWTGTDHTREHIPVLVYGPKVKPGSLGHRETFADIGQTIAKYFGTSDMAKPCSEVIARWRTAIRAYDL